MSTDKRRYERFVFPSGSKIKTMLVLADGRGSVEAKILNISIGGLGLAAERGKIDKLQEELELHLENVHEGGATLANLSGKAVRIKWILDYSPLNNLGIGCEFVEVDEALHKEISSLLREE